MIRCREDRAGVEALIDELYDALDAGDMERFESINAQDPEVVHIGTEREEHWIGWEMLRVSTQGQIEALRSFRVTHRDRRVRLLGSGDVACFSQIMDLQVETDDLELRLEHARLTGVAEKRDGSWVLVQSHLSMPDR